MKQSLSQWINIQALNSLDKDLDGFFDKSTVTFKFIFWNIIEQDTTTVEFEEQVCAPPLKIIFSSWHQITKLKRFLKSNQALVLQCSVTQTACIEKHFVTGSKLHGLGDQFLHIWLCMNIAVMDKKVSRIV